MQLFLKILSGMANSVDPDQTAPLGAVWFGSALFTHAILLVTFVYEILGHLLDTVCNWCLCILLIWGSRKARAVSDCIYSKDSDQCAPVQFNQKP